MINVIIELENFDLQLEYSYFFVLQTSSLSFLNSLIVVLSYGKHFLADKITC